MSMSKRDFIELADVIKSDINDFHDGTIERLADFCASQNPRFNRVRWLDYIAGKCGPSGGAVK